jgi:D-ribulokinase
VLLGAAMLGAVAAGAHPTLAEAMTRMTRLGAMTAPTERRMARFHAAKRRVYGLMHKLDLEGRAIMRGLDDGTPGAAEAELAACC